MRTINYLTAILALALLASCGGPKGTDVSKQNEEKLALLEKANMYFEVLPTVAENPENPITDAKVALGKKLFLEPRLSSNGTISCNSCHNLETFGVDNLPTSPGDDGTIGTRNSPTVFNAALHLSQFWDGRAATIEEQAGMPITNPVEMMMVDENAVVERVKSLTEYAPLFAEVYPEESDPITFKNITFAIGAFERTLMTPSRFDDFLAGNAEALSYEEAKGMETFINSGCIACHRGALLGGGELQKFPLFGSYEAKTGSTTIDKGKFEVTKNEADAFLFKPQSLRNVEKTAPYFHDGKVAELETAVQIMSELSLNKTLTEEETNSIVTFLKSLTMKQ